jgi:hypothetical protein
MWVDDTVSPCASCTRSSAYGLHVCRLCKLAFCSLCTLLHEFDWVAGRNVSLCGAAQEASVQ